MISCFGILLFLLQPRNKEQEQEVLNWVFAVIGEKVPSGQYEDILKDGIWLCKLANKLAPGSVKKIQERGTNFQLMENIQRFQAAVKKYGVPEEEIFQTADLFERRNIPQVTLSLYALGRIVSLEHQYFLVYMFLISYALYRRKSIRNSLVPLWAQRWQKRTSVPSPRSSSVLMRVNSTCRWASTRVPLNRAMVASATHAICKLAISTLQHTHTHKHTKSHTQTSTPKTN